MSSTTDLGVARIPVLPLQATVLFPDAVSTVQVEGEANTLLLEENPAADTLLVLAYSPRGGAREIRKEQLSPVAVLARVLGRLRLSPRSHRVTFQGLRRVKLAEIYDEGPYFFAQIEELNVPSFEPVSALMQVRQVIGTYEALSGADEKYPRDLLDVVRLNLEEPARVADLLGASLRLDYAEKVRIIQAVEVPPRLEALYEILKGSLERLRVAQEVERRAKGDMEESRREYFLRQQMKTIRKELGEEELSERDADEYDIQLEALGLPDEVVREARREIERLRHIQPSSSEYQVVKTFLDRFFALPWGVNTEEVIELPKVRAALDEGHHGLEKVKERILEFLAVRKLNPAHKGPILCFAGPPGVGKTSLGQAIAEAIGRRFFRISVGGVRDEAEIRGHRRTYVGALPGKILTGLTRAGCMNPLLMLDEIDKIGSDHRGDPASALLEVLDPEQNDTFTDHYFNVPFDLSKVLFIVNANFLHDIPKPLLDRLEVIQVQGYTDQEKLHIARSHLIPKVRDEHGLIKGEFTFKEEAILHTIHGFTREAGVRSLQRSLQKVARKLAREKVEGAVSLPEVLGATEVERYLGAPTYLRDEGMDHDEIGVANGLAWTASGGEVLIIEAIKMKGRGRLVITGKLGEVMKESVQAAHSFVKSRASLLNLESEALDDVDLHIHFPAGAVPKDGPSAGVTVTLAIASLVSGLPVRSDLAMTGEVTLRGKVLAVGGIKDKILAAYRAGITSVALPRQNEKDLTEIPEEIRCATRFHLVDHVDELLHLALIGYPPLKAPEVADVEVASEAVSPA